MRTAEPTTGTTRHPDTPRARQWATSEDATRRSFVGMISAARSGLRSSANFANSRAQTRRQRENAYVES